MCYGIVGAVEKWNSCMWAECVCSKLLAKKKNYTEKPKIWHVAMSGPFHDGEQIV